MTYFKGSLLFTAACLIVAGLIAPSGHLLTTLFIVSVLGVLETSLSFDNAVVNAKVLAGMSDVWRRRFLTWGIAIAVFGMRIVFPLAIVAVFAWVSPWEALTLAVTDGDRYAAIMHQAHPQIAAFGGAFLLLVFLQFFVDEAKEDHWFLAIEAPLAALGRVFSNPAAQLGALTVIAILTVYGVASHLPPVEFWPFMKAGLAGIAVWGAVETVSHLLDVDGGPAAAKSGLMGFLYLEVLDASFSFDGVIGAFALSHNLFVIALGLGIGAMFVRSMTVWLVERGTLNQYRYLEHGAFWAIGALAGVMLASVHYQIPEAVTGLAGAFLIGAGWLSSVVVNRRQATA